MTSTAVDAPRELEVPTDLADALERDLDALRAFERLSYSQQRLFIARHQSGRIGTEIPGSRPTRTPRVIAAVPNR